MSVTSQSLLDFRDRYAYGEIGQQTPSLDLWALAALVNACQPKTFLEVGTYIGYTTRHLARIYPRLYITTVDPGDQIAPMDRSPIQAHEYLAPNDIGHLVDSHPKVTIVKAPFLLWAGRYKGHLFDLIFLDGDHRYDAVMGDTTAALALVRSPDGVLVWHDANHLDDVDRALQDIAHRFQHRLPNGITTVEHTWLAYALVTG
jgi:predicted O-methyltransferase YrrM